MSDASSNTTWIEGRKALLVFTDGSDSRPAAGGSKASLKAAIEAGKHSEVTIYTVGFVAESREVNRDFLERLARATGGRAFFPVNVDHLERSFSAIQEELHTQYRIGYTPRNDVDGKKSAAGGSKASMEEATEAGKHFEVIDVDGKKSAAAGCKR